MEINGNNLGAKKGKKGQKDFYCEKCDFKCSKKYSWDRHLVTSKHTKEILGNDLGAKKGKKEENNYICENCEKCFNTNAGLWKHTKICKQNITIYNNDNDTSNSIINNNINNSNSNKDELIQYLINENKEFKNLILELAKKDSLTNNNINNITHTNSHNKTFNLQLFLNETCKDAMNMSDFIDSVKLQLSDLECVGKLGFVDGISNIIIQKLEALDIQKRPVHCSDSKRETMYIKDHDKWEKDDSEMKQMKGLVRTVRDQNISLIATWRNLYPECVKSNSKKTTQFNEICMEAFGGETGGDKGTKQEKEEKIISKIAKSVIIDKS
jgi:hypothetical protein